MVDVRTFSTGAYSQKTLELYDEATRGVSDSYSRMRQRIEEAASKVSGDLTRMQKLWDAIGELGEVYAMLDVDGAEQALYRELDSLLPRIGRPKNEGKIPGPKMSVRRRHELNIKNVRRATNKLDGPFYASDVATATRLSLRTVINILSRNYSAWGYSREVDSQMEQFRYYREGSILNTNP